MTILVSEKKGEAKAPRLVGSAVLSGLRMPSGAMVRQVVQVMLLVMLLMALYQVIKYQINPQLALITSNVITVIFSTVVAGWASYFIIKRQHQLTHRLTREVQRREAMEHDLRRIQGRLEQQVAERTENLAQANQILIIEVAERKRHEATLHALNKDLQGKMRELTVLYDICRRRAFPRSEEEILRDAATLLPAAWDDCLTAGARIVQGERSFTSANFDPAQVVITQPVPLGEGRSCAIEISLRSAPGGEPLGRLVERRGEFLRSVADFLSKAVERKVNQRERARLEALVRQTHKMEALGTLAGGIAHDFNNILGMIIGCTELAQQLGTAGKDNREELERVLRAADQARKTVRQILDFSREDKGNRQPLNINELSSRVLDMLGRTLPKMIVLETHLTSDLHMVNADANQLEQVLLNLVTNAADAMPEGGRLVVETRNLTLDESPEPHPADLEPGRYVLLSVADTGQGMDAMTMEHAFDPFYTTKEVGKGTGLGLAVVYGIVKRHQGMVQCQSLPEEGSLFRVYLPAYEGRQPAPAKAPPLREESLRGEESILFVDDEELLRRIVAEILSAAGYMVHTAANGEDALEMITSRSRSYDLVVTDLGMPGMGGGKFLLRLKAMNPSARVVVASGYEPMGMVKDLLEKGDAAFVAKPFRRMELLATVRHVLDNQPPC